MAMMIVELASYLLIWTGCFTIVTKQDNLTYFHDLINMRTYREPLLIIITLIDLLLQHCLMAPPREKIPRHTWVDYCWGSPPFWRIPTRAKWENLKDPKGGAFITSFNINEDELIYPGPLSPWRCSFSLRRWWRPEELLMWLLVPHNRAFSLSSACHCRFWLSPPSS